MLKQQLELSLAGGKEANETPAKKKGRRGPQFWFDQMRQLVDRAIDWGSLDSPAPRQTFLRFQPAKKERREDSWQKAA